MERPARSLWQHGRAGQELSGWAETLLGSAEASGASAKPLPPRHLQRRSSSSTENCGCPKQVWGRPEPDSRTPVAVKEICSSGIPFSPSAAADLDSGPDSAPDLVTDEEDGGEERDLRLPGVTVGELPGLPGHGRRGSGGDIWGRSGFSPGMGGYSPACCLQVLRRR